MRIFYDYGEEKWSKRIAEFICEKRKTKPVETTFELVEIIKAAIPKKPVWKADILQRECSRR